LATGATIVGAIFIAAILVLLGLRA
jgi:hypothetical protein